MRSSARPLGERCQGIVEEPELLGAKLACVHALAALTPSVVIFGSMPFTDAMIVRYLEGRIRSRVARARLATSIDFNSAAACCAGRRKRLGPQLGDVARRSLPQRAGRDFPGACPRAFTTPRAWLSQQKG